MNNLFKSLGNLDVYVADMERIEVLPGPQGTLFGASSQAGTVRLITNKPKFEVSESGFNGSLFNTSNGDMSSSFDAFVNVPVSDTWAIRGVLPTLIMVVILIMLLVFGVQR